MTEAWKTRQQVENHIRSFFTQDGFQEVRTPLLVASPGMEVHIRPLKLENSSSYLPTSPEFAMKKLLARGFEKIFQICPAFRNEPCSKTHLPEFTLLEWYRTHATYEDIMADTERMIENLAIKLNNKTTTLTYQNKKIDLRRPWPRLSIATLFEEYVGVDVLKEDHQELLSACNKNGIIFNSTDTWEDLFFKLWLNIIEPKLPHDRPVIVRDYPASQAALANIGQTGKHTFAKRFEVYIGGLELANAFDELTDPLAQRHRFENDMKKRQELYGKGFPASPIDEEFLEALKKIPPCAGIALGVDRLAMLFANVDDISLTHLLTPYWQQ